MKAKAVVHGAVSIVNALASGKGSSLGISLTTEVFADIERGKGEVDLIIEGVKFEDRDKVLVDACIKIISEKFNEEFHGSIRINTNIPIAVGLKSSSVASNALILALTSALGISLDDFEIVKLGVEASKLANVTVTGAFDDACASYFGGIVFTDNSKMKIIKRIEADERLLVVICIPKDKTKRYTSEIDKEKLLPISRASEAIFNFALLGNYFEAMTLNGILYSSALGFNFEPSLAALRIGALGAGLSGKGPAIAAVCSKEVANEIVNEWKKVGNVILAKVNNRKARVEKID